MKIKTSDFVISAVKPDQWPKDGLPEIALAGRSNVGKSSLINTLLNRKNLARTSQRPGKTQTLNYFIINEAFYFVDVPGYGYAKVSQSERRAWIKMLETYLTQNKQLKVVVQVIDLRHAPSAEDVQMYHFLKHYGIPVILVTTKADKISRGKYQQHHKIIREKLDKDPNDPMVLFSSFSGLGKDDVWQTISNYLET